MGVGARVIPGAKPPSRRESECAWELRGAWAIQREIVVAWPGGRVRGYVEHVAATNAFALVWDGTETVHVPLALLPSIRRPHYHEPLDGQAVAPPTPVRRELPMAGQLTFAFDDRRVDRSPYS
jgi:hypothetical protein